MNTPKKLYLQIKREGFEPTTIELNWKGLGWQGSGKVNEKIIPITLEYSDEHGDELFLMVNNAGKEQRLKPIKFSREPFYVSFVFSKIYITITG